MLVTGDVISPQNRVKLILFNQREKIQPQTLKLKGAPAPYPDIFLKNHVTCDVIALDVCLSSDEFVRPTYRQVLKMRLIMRFT